MAPTGKKISGTIQNDILKEFIAQKEYIFPPRQSMRLITDIFAFCAKEVPKWNTISVSGYHIREAGSTSLQELAFTLRDGLEYVQYGVDAGLDVDDFVPRMSFFFNSHSDFFEEIAKYRAARKLWAEAMKNRFGAKNPRSWQLRFHTQTAGVSLTAQQPYNNVVRTALQALAAVLGGTNSLHTNSLDEALALPTKRNRHHRAAHAADHRARKRRDQRGRSARRLVLRRAADARHGRRHAASTGTPSMAWAAWSKRSSAAIPQKEIAEASYQFQQAVERREKTIVGVNDFIQTDEKPIEILYIDDARGGSAAAAAGRAQAHARQRSRPPHARRLKAGAQGHATTPCRCCSIACAPMRRSARCATRSARCGASTRKCRLSSSDQAYRHRGSGNRMSQKIRVVIAKPGLDGHDRGAKVIARALRDAGMEVIYTGLRQTPEQIVSAALQEDADVIGLSILSGAHMHICPRVMELLKEKGLDDVQVVIGGIIPDIDIAKLNAMGIKGIFIPGTPMQHIIDYITANARARV